MRCELFKHGGAEVEVGDGAGLCEGGGYGLGARDLHYLFELVFGGFNEYVHLMGLRWRAV